MCLKMFVRSRICKRRKHKNKGEKNEIEKRIKIQRTKDASRLDG